MAFDKKYPNRKDKRKPYTDARSFDSTCRNHGSCAQCKSKRTHFDTKNRSAADDKLKYLGDE